MITVVIDIFRSSDLSDWGKAAWFLFVRRAREGSTRDPVIRRPLPAEAER
jgi:hypothetical protein